MTQEFYFHEAKWVGLADCTNRSFSVLRGRFSLPDVGRVTLRALGLGFFRCYINGRCINPDTFLPLSSDYEGSNDPVNEVISKHRIYVPEFDITPYVRTGENSIALHYGGGWYCFEGRVFGLPKAIYHMTAVTEAGETLEFGSDETCRIGKSYLSDYCFVNRECHDFTAWQDAFSFEYDDSSWENAVEMPPLMTEYCSTDCPTDRLMRTLPVKAVGRYQDGVIYDCGENTTGYPVLQLSAECGKTVTVDLYEELTPDGQPDGTHWHRQHYAVVSDGSGRMVHPEFTWFGFRYFVVFGKAEPQYVREIHADIKVGSTFESDHETLNWIYRTFLHTMLCNMHTGHPSDCPHLERRGYTGDGQLTCHAVLSTMDAKAFYEKWMRDIGDCQDVLSGHIQYTAPYIRSGGGPGGWGCAIVEVPYQLYRHYGDTAILSEYYPNMRRYLDYLEAHSEFGLVTSDQPGQWCLGDWCGPNILYPDKDITSHNQQVILPAPMINTYFMVKSMQKMCEIAKIIGEEQDIAEYEQKIAYRKNAIRAAYFNAFDDNFVMNVQGANAFAVDLGLGNEQTYRNLVRYYEKLGCYDTGIFGTDVLTRILFEHGDAELAFKLLTQNGAQGYEHWRRAGATTFHEYWDSNRSRSHNHPMFGAPVAYFFAYLLGIRQKEGSAGYRKLEIAPQVLEEFGYLRGSMHLPNGVISVDYRKTKRGFDALITIPQNIKAEFIWKDDRIPLNNGENRLVLV